VERGVGWFLTIPVVWKGLEGFVVGAEGFEVHRWLSGIRRCENAALRSGLIGDVVEHCEVVVPGNLLVLGHCDGRGHHSCYVNVSNS
jgi:hypothetical protein